MKQLFGRFIATVCTVALIVSCMGASALAVEVESEDSTGRYVQLNANAASAKLVQGSMSVNSASLEKINSDFTMMGKTGLLSVESQIVDIDIQGENAVYYTVNLGGYENIISVNSHEDGVDFYSKQGDIENLVTIKDDGYAYIDGQRAGLSRNKDSVVVANSTTHWSNGPFYGTGSMYDKFRKHEEIKSVEFVNAVGDLTIATFMLFLGPIFGDVANMIGLATALADVYQKYVDNNPATKYASYKADSYTVKDGTGYIDDVYGWNYKYKFTFYMAANFDAVNYPVIYKTMYEMITSY